MANSTFDASRWQRLGEIFRGASELDPSERTAFLEKQCANDPALRAEVEELLLANENASSLLDDPVVLSKSIAETIDKEPVQMPHQPGEILSERFKIVRLLGKGGMGHVYEAEDLELNIHVALKFLKPQIAFEQRARRRFHREITLARRVTHPNACRIFDLFRHRDSVFLTMELLEGETLDERIGRSGPFTVSEALPLIEGMAAALAAAHEVGVVHRDFKSGNVMLVSGSGGTRAVVTDFGLATTLREESWPLSVSETGRVIGTPEFMAPEQLQGAKVTPATDIYALGLVIFQMLTGNLPFQADTPFQLINQRLHQPAPSPRDQIPQLDRRWERTVLRCLERDPADRFQTPAEVVACLRGETSTIRFLPRRRHRLRIALALIASIVIAVAGFFAWQRNQTATQQASATVDFQERDWVLISSFDNRTGEAVFDGTIEYALQREIGNSGFVNVIPPERIGDALRLMKKKPDTKLDREMAREVALRDGGIKVLLTGRIERLGALYIVTAEVIDPLQAATLSSLSEEAEGVEQVSDAVRRLSLRLRQTLGEAIQDIEVVDKRLSRVTTSSLNALKLYSEAEALIHPGAKENQVVEQLLKQAIAEDPDFASAYNLLAYAATFLNRPYEERLHYSQRAFDLCELASEQERYFIRGSYFRLRGHLEESLSNFQTLAQLYPDHMWACGNVASILSYHFHRFEDATPYWLRAVEVRPNLFGLLYELAKNLALLHNPPENAAPYIERASRLISKNDAPWMVAWIRFYSIHKAWLKQDVDTVLKEAQLNEERLKALSGAELDTYARYVGAYYLSLGKFKAAEDVFRLQSETAKEKSLREVAFYEAAMRDARELRKLVPREVLHLQASRAPRLEVAVAAEKWQAVYAARAGLLWKARQMIGSFPKPVTKFEEGLCKAVQGELALAEGKPEAVALLQEAIAQISRFPEDASWYFSIADSLALALERAGHADKAAMILEQASKEKFRAFSGKVYWMKIRLRLAEYYRKQGKHSEAERIIAELRNLLKYADSDFWLLHQVNQTPGR